MKDTIDYKELADKYAKNSLEMLRDENGKLNISCDEKDALFLLRHGYMDGRIDGEFDMFHTQNNIQKYLLYLQTAGWSDLIDDRWKDKVNKQLKIAFPDITEEDLEEIDKIVLI